MLHELISALKYHGTHITTGEGLWKMTGFSEKKAKNSVDSEYIKAVNQLRRFLSDSDISDEASYANFRNELSQVSLIF